MIDGLTRTLANIGRNEISFDFKRKFMNLYY
jgi:hypothetical protein